MHVQHRGGVGGWCILVDMPLCRCVEGCLAFCVLGCELRALGERSGMASLSSHSLYRLGLEAGLRCCAVWLCCGSLVCRGGA